MTKYSWDIETLIKERNKARDLKDKYDELFTLYDDLIKNYDDRIEAREYELDFNDTSLPFNARLLIWKEAFEKDTKEVENDLLTNAIPVLKPYAKAKMYEQEPSLFILNNDALIEMGYNILKELNNKKLEEEYLKFVNPDNHLLHIRMKRNYDNQYLGTVQVDPEKHITYGYVGRKNSIDDVVTLLHEFLHTVVRKNSEFNFNGTNKVIYTETEGYFANLIFNDILEKQYPKEKSLIYRDKFDLLLSIDTIQSLYSARVLINLMNTSGNFKYAALNETLREANIPVRYNQRNIASFFDFDTDSINLAISYLVALDLFNLYKKDSEKALHHVLNISNLSGNEPQKDLESIDVHFFEDNYTNLTNHCKTLLKTKKAGK